MNWNLIILRPNTKSVFLASLGSTPLKRDNFQEILEKAGKSLGWKPFPIPVAIHSKINSHTGGSSCMQCGWCSGYPCQFRAKSSVELVLFPRASETGNFEVK